METTQKKEIISAVKQYMELHGLNQSDLSNNSNVRKEYISIMLKDDSDFMYDAGGGQKGEIHPKYFHALADYVGYKSGKVYWDIKNTPQSDAILANLQDARDNHLTLTLIGETGAGKSFIAGLFAKKHPRDTYIVTAGSSDTLTDLIDKMLDALKAHATGQSKSAKLRAIAQKMQMLKNYGNKPMLIIDESEYLKVAALCAMKELYDNLHEHCAIIFIGTDQLAMNIEKLRRRNKSGIPQFHRRIKFGLRRLPSIDRSYKIFLDQVKDKELRAFILKNCDNYGEVHDALVPAMREADRTGVELSLGLVRKVLNITAGDVVW
ncbi:MAG: ATP-binding protein [Bacteroidetes bacterium]|nr:ATP-binding protein [Bacteroidota bacterium]